MVLLTSTGIAAAIRETGQSPEALATHLLQYGQASETRDGGDCAGMTGREHCTKCAMPSIQNLVTQLVAVKTAVWTDQHPAL
jgi:hypothetical protein